MILEHTFTTRKETNEVLVASLSALEHAGYTVSEAPADDAILARRGARSLRRAHKLVDSPIAVCVHARRGLVSVGIDIESKSRKPDRQMLTYAVTLAKGLERVHRASDAEQPPIDLNDLWTPVQQRSKVLHRRQWIVLSIVLAMPVLLVILVLVLG